MKSVFELDREDGRKLFLDGWSVGDCKPFSKKDCSQIKTAVVEAGDYGMQVRFYFNQGGSMIYDVSKFANGLKAIGEVLEPSKLFWVTLTAVGQRPIRKISDHREEIESAITKSGEIEDASIMKSVFEIDRGNDKKLYYDWDVTDCKSFSKEDCAAVTKAVVEKGEYGLQVRLYFKQGGNTAYGVIRNANGLDKPGEVIDPSKLFWIRLSAIGNKDVIKISDHTEDVTAIMKKSDNDSNIEEDTTTSKSGIVEKNLFEIQRDNSKKLCPDGWSVIDCKPFSKTDCEQIKTAVVENGDYGLQVRFYFKQGGSFFYGVSKNAENLSAGDVLDPHKLYWVYLAAVGQHSIRKVSNKMEDLFEIQSFPK